ALKAMREEHRNRRARVGKASFALEDASRSGKIVAELQDVNKAFGDKIILRDFSTIIQRGDRVGIVGANGAGKSTLVKLLLGELAPDDGSVTLGSKLEIAYSDQLRGALDPDKNLIDSVCGGQEFIDIKGKRKHAISYLGDFLFTPDRVRTPVKALSGGEQNRAVLAQLFSKPANLLVLDEPTNDLDIETLELLEEILLDFDGTVILVSHDRDFMNRVVTSLLVVEGDGVVNEQAGGYSDWEARGGRLSAATAKAATPTSAVPAAKPAPAKQKKRSYKEQRELNELPGKIDTLEQRQAELEATIAEPDFYQRGRETTETVLAELTTVQQQLEAALERWMALDEDD
ncbi:MAG: ATP-binding cassette domain-containing protein, partial [Parahaliea sp.]